MSLMPSVPYKTQLLNTVKLLPPDGLLPPLVMSAVSEGTAAVERSMPLTAATSVIF